MCPLYAVFLNDPFHKKRIIVRGPRKYKQLKMLMLYKKAYIFMNYVLYEGFSKMDVYSKKGKKRMYK
jgi:hypothetical protein